MHAKRNKHYYFGTCHSEPGPHTRSSGPDQPDHNLCPTCGLFLVDCKCSEVCPKYEEAVKDCKCFKKVDCSKQAIRNGGHYNWNKCIDTGLALKFLNKTVMPTMNSI